MTCTHNSMIERKDDSHAWQCADCGYVYGADVGVSDCGSVVMVRPLTATAKDWVTEHLSLESWQYLGESFAVEPRYVTDLLRGMRESGLEVQ